MKRSASLDFLRGAAALRGCDPSLSDSQRAVSAVHGIVRDRRRRGLLRAQRLCARPSDRRLGGGKPWRNLGVFLIRRWMRTIPPYVVALVVIALLTGNLMTADFVRYLFYVENLFSSANHVDFYPVAWSPGGRGMVLSAVCSRAVSCRAAAREGRQAARGQPLRSWSLSRWRRCGSRSHRTTGI